jgi:hypothetical protein
MTVKRFTEKPLPASTIRRSMLSFHHDRNQSLRPRPKARRSKTVMSGSLQRTAEWPGRTQPVTAAAAWLRLQSAAKSASLVRRYVCVQPMDRPVRPRSPSRCLTAPSVSPSQSRFVEPDRSIGEDHHVRHSIHATLRRSDAYPAIALLRDDGTLRRAAIRSSTAPASSIRLVGSGTWVSRTGAGLLKPGGDESTGLPSELGPGEERGWTPPLSAGAAPNEGMPLPCPGVSSSQGGTTATGGKSSSPGVVVVGGKIWTACGWAGSSGWAGSTGNGAVARSAKVEATQRLVTTACGSFSHAPRVPTQGRQRQVRWSNIIRCTR